MRSSCSISRKAGRKAVAPIDARALFKRLEAAKFGEKRVRRSDLQALDDLQVLSAAHVRVRTTRVIGGVLIFGIDQLDPVPAGRHSANKTGLLKAVVSSPNNIGRARAKPEAQRDFVLRWEHAMIAEMGLEDFERYYRSEIERGHGFTALTGDS